MEAIKNKVFKKGIFPKNTWVYIKSSYNNVIKKINLKIKCHEIKT
jgi:hypothetical protein